MSTEIAVVRHQLPNEAYFGCLLTKDRILITIPWKRRLPQMMIGSREWTQYSGRAAFCTLSLTQVSTATQLHWPRRLPGAAWKMDGGENVMLKD